MYSHNFLFCAAFLSFAGTVALLVGLAPSLPVACKSVCCSRASSVPSLRCFAFGSACCVAALSTSRFRFFFCDRMLDVRDGHLSSVVLSALCCLRLGFLRLPALVFLETVFSDVL